MAESEASALENELNNVKIAGGGGVDSKKRLDYIGWEDYFMAIACLSAQRSKDPVTQVGACIVSPERKIVGIGYNGMPIGCSDDVLPWGKTDPTFNKFMFVCHAEVNAIMNKNSSDVKNCTLFTTRFPCNECAKIIIQSGIVEVVYQFLGPNPEDCSTTASRLMFDMAGVRSRKFEGKVDKVTIELTS